MVYYKLSSDPNFTFEVSPEGESFYFHFRYIRGLMYVTIQDINGNRIAGPVRVCNKEWLIPYSAHNYEGAGNFMVVNKNDEYPDFERFNEDCLLQYFTLDEIEEG